MTALHRDTQSPVHMQWMAETANLEHLRIDELILPGSHNSGSDKQSPNLGIPMEYAQDEAPLEQLRNGIRVLDLRVLLDDDHPEGDPNRFQLFHLTSSGRTVAVDIIEAVRAFFAELESSGAPAREIVILDFHQFKYFNDQAHAQLQAQLFNELGARVIPDYLHSWTLGQLWEYEPGRNVVVSYNSDRGGEPGWDGVTQRWSGSEIFNTNTLKNFIDKVAEEYKEPFYLRAVQCAKYSLPLHAPTDLSHKLDEWFESVDENSYIQNFYIINTDWTLRSHLIANCRHANEIRGARNLSHPHEHLQPTRR